jgi:hypothetical protein
MKKAARATPMSARRTLVRQARNQKGVPGSPACRCSFREYVREKREVLSKWNATPGNADDCENKRVVGRAVRKLIKRKASERGVTHGERRS